MVKKSGGVMVFLLLFGCISPETKPPIGKTTGLRKVMISSSQEVERLRNFDLEIIVQEEKYVVVRQDSAQIKNLQNAGFTTLPIKGSDLVQRLVRVHFSSREQLQQIIDMGVDFWKQEGDSLTARAFDIHLSRMQAAGIGYRILARDASKWEGEK